MKDEQEDGICPGGGACREVCLSKAGHGFPLPASADFASALSYP